LLLLAFRMLRLCPLLLFFFFRVFEARLGVVEPLLPEEPEPKPDLVEDARWREVEAFAETNLVVLRYCVW
jgi:hypothetical protein